MQRGVEKNRIWFNKSIKNAWGMPQATFEYLPTDDAAKEAQEMMTECVEKSYGTPVMSLTPDLA